MFKLAVSQAKGVVIEAPEKFLKATQVRAIKQAAPSITEEQELRTLEIREFCINKIILGERTEINGTTLTVDMALAEKALSVSPLVKKVAMDLIEPHQRNVPTHSMMDILPVAAKVKGTLGEGITNCLSGVVVVLTGTDEQGKQISEFGSSHGILAEKVKFGMPGTPGARDIILRIDVVLEAGTGMERRGPLAAHQVCDFILEDIRRLLSKLSARQAARVDTFRDVRRPGKPRILIVKEVGGQGAMHEKLLLPAEPGGVRGAKSIIDLGNMPVVLSPNEVKDGAIHSMT
ncbi:D-proline reductase proprotein PrdA [Pelotomaculum schinkii]|uniref:D-proline reductase proprotein PrdA n=1 Tax=Pelotomaculum schinkii TaxID=78350 RepID=A0A4Y7RBH5_9FIRM|nr:proline reductase cluster protein PrdD [Pelotomaculum schinkii]TEB06073.1 D-proline reductase proprotein PrdA [Pelotomaculum schinkii]